MGERDTAETHLAAQLAASLVTAEATAREVTRDAALTRQDVAFSAALDEIQKVRDFVGAPQHILGSPSTKHGEIAEQVEVGMRRARQLLEGLTPTAWKDGLPRTGPVDYVIDGVNVQSKFVNGVAANLDHVLEHMRKYPRFGRDGSYYHIPRDHYELIESALNGKGHGQLSARTLSNIADKAREIRQLSGQESLSAVVRPGISDYADVQQGRVHRTLDGHERTVEQRNDALTERIQTEHAPTLSGMMDVAAQGAAVGAAIRLTAAVWQKHKSGKRLFSGDYTSSDWQELGVEVGTGGAQGAVSAAAIYGLTHAAGLAAPFAGAAVSSAMAFSGLSRRYYAGELSLEELCELGQLTCLEGAFVGLAAASGQAVLPIPLLGAAVGAIVARMLASLAKDLLARDQEALAERLRLAQASRMALLDEASRHLVEGVLARYDALGSLTDAAFDRDKNVELRLAASARLAQAYGVSDALESVDEIDDYFLR